MSLTRPPVLLLLAVLVHILGRTAAVCHPYKADSYVYATAAHRLWHGGATFADLIPDKPPGQALLTGWCYRLAPEPHTRLTLIPIESAFLLAAYAVFWLVARRLCGPGVAAALTLFFAIAHNTYNALDFTTDGFDLNECYLALPMMLAVWAHLNVKSPAKRGLLRGVAIGLALSVKQSAVGLLLALMVHGFAETCLGRRAKQGATSGAMTLLGLAVAWAPVVLFLHAHGWLAAHLQDLAEFTGNHLTALRITLPRWYNVSPLLPGGWWLILGAVGSLGLWHQRRTGVIRNGLNMGSHAPDGQDAPVAEALPPLPHGRGSAYRPRPGTYTQQLHTRGSLAVFLLLWLAAELCILATMNKPSSHYYQQLVMPLLLLAGTGLTVFARAVVRLPAEERRLAWRWAAVATVVLTVIAAMPLGAQAAKRARTLDHQAEVREFAWYLANWSERWNIPDDQRNPSHADR